MLQADKGVKRIMKFDMHCHTKEGSIDAKVDMESYVRKLVSLGYDGMLVTDHNSYRGYDQWEKLRTQMMAAAGKPFVVLRGIEYDTRDAGHMLVVLPEKVRTRMLEARGLKGRQLIRRVHELGGIVGPAHPYGNGFFALMNTRLGKRNEMLMNSLDFVESFNACVTPLQNRLAKRLADKYQKPEFGGSDAHRPEVIGSAFTEIAGNIRSNDDLIEAVRMRVPMIADGDWEDRVRKKQKKIVEELAVIGYWIYNKLFAGLNVFRRRKYAKLS